MMDTSAHFVALRTRFHFVGAAGVLVELLVPLWPSVLDVQFENAAAFIPAV